jgi:hypothetical protein
MRSILPGHDLFQSLLLPVEASKAFASHAMVASDIRKPSRLKTKNTSRFITSALLATLLLTACGKEEAPPPPPPPSESSVDDLLRNLQQAPPPPSEPSRLTANPAAVEFKFCRGWCNRSATNRQRYNYQRWGAGFEYQQH